MKHIQLISYAILVLILASSCSGNKEKSSQTVEGTIKGLGNNSIILMDERNNPLDTVWAQNDQFKFVHEFNIADPIRYGIFIPQLSNADGGRRQNKSFFFIDSKAIHITGDIVEDNLENVEVEGSPITKEYKDLDYNLPANVGLREIEKPYNEAFTKYNNVEQSEENLAQLNFYGRKADSLFKLRRDNMIDAIKDNKESIALTNIIYWNFQNESAEFIKDILDQFSPNIKNSHYLALLESQLKLKEAASVGAMAPNFSAIDEQGNKVNLSDFKGDGYLLLDFWASWCGPCRKEIPNLKLAHDKFNDKGLKIISISIDDSKEKWEKALEQENLPYAKLYDEGKLTLNLYQYNAIPFIVLVSPEGKIVRINDGLRGEELQETLEGLL